MMNTWSWGQQTSTSDLWRGRGTPRSPWGPTNLNIHGREKHQNRADRWHLISERCTGFSLEKNVPLRDPFFSKRASYVSFEILFSLPNIRVTFSLCLCHIGLWVQDVAVGRAHRDDRRLLHIAREPRMCEESPIHRGDELEAVCSRRSHRDERPPTEVPSRSWPEGQGQAPSGMRKLPWCRREHYRVVRCHPRKPDHLMRYRRLWSCSFPRAK